MKLLANIVTTVLHPVALTIPAVFLIVFDATRSYEEALYWTFLSILFAGIISVFVLYGVKKGFFNNIDVSNRKQRIILYPFVIAVVLIFALLVYLQNGPLALIYTNILFVLALVIMDLINTKIKASVHVAAVSSVVTGLIFQFGVIAVPLFIFIPIIAWARIREKRHSFPETIAGAIAGISLTFIGLFVVQFML